MNLPPGLPPLPPVPDGYDVNAWAYRGTNWNPGEFRNYAYYKPGLSDGWVPSFGMKPIGSSGHYIEAVREPAEPSAQLFATLDPENDASACPECVQGYVQETGFNRCEQCNPAASGVEARVCGWMPIETAPRDGTRILGTWVSTWTDGAPHIEAIECGENGVWFYSYDGDGPPRSQAANPLATPPAATSRKERL